MNDHRGVDQIDRAVALGRLEVLQRNTGTVLRAERCDEQLNRARTHV
jgi:hypothetical protein